MTFRVEKIERITGVELEARNIVQIERVRDGGMPAADVHYQLFVDKSPNIVIAAEIKGYTGTVGKLCVHIHGKTEIMTAACRLGAISSAIESEKGCVIVFINP